MSGFRLQDLEALGVRAVDFAFQVYPENPLCSSLFWGDVL